MLSWSAAASERIVDLSAIVDPRVDPRITGGRALIALATTAVGTTSDGEAVASVAELLGPAAALKAATVAAAFEVFNRIVDATGLPVGQKSREQLQPIIDMLGLADLPHASH